MNRLAATVALPLALLAGGQAHAQDAGESEQSLPEETTPGGAPLPEPDADGEITVTGSRISSAGFQAPTPTTVIGAEALDRTAPLNVEEVLTNVPAFRSSSQASTAAVYANLRGIGASRTLVLVDGRRRVPTYSDGTFDLGTVPSALLERVEVVTGGASASWGSDAVAGVVNLILRDDLEGVVGSAQYGISKYGDDESWQASVAAGTSFAGGRGHVLVGGEYSRSSGVDGLGPPWLSRPWSGRGVVGNSNFATNGLPGTIYAHDVRAATESAGGVITSGPLRGLQFEDNNQTSAFEYGTVFGSDMIGGGKDNFGFNRSYATTLKAAYENISALARASFELTGDVKIFAEGSFSRSISNSVTNIISNRGSASAASCTQTTLASATGSISVDIDNPFLPQSVRDRMIDAGVTCFAMGKNYNGSGLGNLETSDGSPEVLSAVVGFEAHLSPTWTLDGYFSRGRGTFRSRRYNNIVTANLAKAVNAVALPSGAIVCRVNADADPANDDPACRPFNLFGPNAASADAVGYVTADAAVDMVIHQMVGALNLSGDLFELPAGTVRLATGAEYRKEKGRAVADPISEAGGFSSGNRKGFAGSYDVREVYGELAVPVLQDVPLIAALDLNAAIRYTDYSSSGGVTTWKVGGTWDITDALRVRATRSRDIRAGNLGELFTPESTRTLQARDPRDASRVALTVITLGNETLAPEKANTFTAGVVYSPPWAPGLRLSADYYKIKISGAIGVQGAQRVLDRCFLENSAAACEDVVLNSSGTITEVFERYQNQDFFETNGLDLELSYRRPLADILPIKSDGELNLHILANYVGKLALTTRDGSVTDPAGQYTSPNWSVIGTLGYSEGPWTAAVEERFYAGGPIDNTKVLGDEAAPKMTGQFLTLM